MRVVGMLVGIPEGDQEALRDQFELSMHRSHDTDEDPFSEIADVRGVFGEYVDWRAEHPSDDLMTQLMTMEFEDETGTRRRLTRDELLIYLILIAVGRQRHDESPHRLDRQGARRQSRRAAPARRRPLTHQQRHRGDPAIRAAAVPRRALPSRTTWSSTARRCPPAA